METKFNSYNESLRDKMTPVDMDEEQKRIYYFIQELKDKEEDEFTGKDIDDIFDFIRESKNVDDKKLLNILIDTGYITHSRILFLIKTSLYNSNKQDPWHYYESQHEPVDEDDIDELIDILKKLKQV